MKEREGRRDVEALSELTRELALLYDDLKRVNVIPWIIDLDDPESANYIRAWNSIVQSNRLVSELRNESEMSGSVESDHITVALDHLVIAEKLLCKYHEERFLLPLMRLSPNKLYKESLF